jgi:hypothetical protein
MRQRKFVPAPPGPRGVARCRLPAVRWGFPIRWEEREWSPQSRETWPVARWVAGIPRANRGLVRFTHPAGMWCVSRTGGVRGRCSENTAVTVVSVLLRSEQAPHRNRPEPSFSWVQGAAQRHGDSLTIRLHGGCGERVPHTRAGLGAHRQASEESTKSEARNPKQARSSKPECPRRFRFASFGFRICFGFRISCFVLAGVSPRRGRRPWHSARRFGSCPSR